MMSVMDWFQGLLAAVGLRLQQTVFDRPRCEVTAGLRQHSVKRRELVRGQPGGRSAHMCADSS